MSSTQYYLAQSLDGYIAGPDHDLDWLTGYEGEPADISEAADRSYEEFYSGVGALAMGSATYEWILANLNEGWPYLDRPSWVFTSRELPVPEGADVRFAAGPVAQLQEEMRGAAGERNLWVVGGGNLAMQFAETDLLDELIVTIVPVVLGAGIPTFAGRLDHGLRLTAVAPHRSGMVELRYELR